MNGPALIGLIAVMGILGFVYAVTDQGSPLPRIGFVLAGAIGIIALDLPWIATVSLFVVVPLGWFAMRVFDRWVVSGAPWEEMLQPSKPGLGEDWKARYGGDATSGNWRRDRQDREEPGYREAPGGKGRQGSHAMDRESALATLGLDGTASDTDIKRAHRRLMKSHHPDRGGSTDMAARLNQAREYLLGE